MGFMERGYKLLYTPYAQRFDRHTDLPLYTERMLSDEAKDRLRDRLNEVHEWPSVYMYKFVMEPEESRLSAVLALFPSESEVLRRYSAGGKYVSVTIREVMMNAEDVVVRYDQATSIQGVIVL
jgi:uncharacterized protein